MENFGSDNTTARKRRSKCARRPNANPKPISNYITSSSSFLDIDELQTNDYSRLESGRDNLSLDTEKVGLNDLGVKSNRLGDESKFKKVKLKVGGVTHTVQMKSMAEIVRRSSPSTEDFQGKSSSTAKILEGPHIRKSRRVGKKRTLDEEYTEEDEEDDDEIRYLGKLRASKSCSSYRENEEIVEAPSKRQKEMLPEVDVLLRKAEAAQRRRLQAQKAAKEAEAEAIRKILGQDSTRKKREEKIKRQNEERAQENNTKATVLGANTVRWAMGPSGTVVTFSDDLGLPNIFSSLSHSCYPPPREKCVGPNCNKEYKYRDSKSKLPLCSLLCYKALQG